MLPFASCWMNGASGSNDFTVWVTGALVFVPSNAVHCTTYVPNGNVTCPVLSTGMGGTSGEPFLVITCPVNVGGPQLSLPVGRPMFSEHTAALTGGGATIVGGVVSFTVTVALQ